MDSQGDGWASVAENWKNDRGGSLAQSLSQEEEEHHYRKLDETLVRNRCTDSCDMENGKMQNMD